MIYTTYFAKLSKLPKEIQPIAICAKCPPGWNGKEYKKLAPKYDFFTQWKEDHNDEHYVKCFNEQVLGKLNAADVVYELVGILDPNEDIDIALVCYEKPSDFCHRHLVAKWLNDNGYDCKEWGVE